MSINDNGNNDSNIDNDNSPLDIDSNNAHLLYFLGKLFISLKDNKLETDQIYRLNKFMISFLFEERLIREDISEDDLYKYLSLGWYVSTFLNQNNPSIINDQTQPRL